MGNKKACSNRFKKIKNFSSSCGGSHKCPPKMGGFFVPKIILNFFCYGVDNITAYGVLWFHT